MCADLGIGYYFETPKSDSDAELTFLQFFFYPKNLPEAPHPPTCCLRIRLRLHRRHDQYQPNLGSFLDALIGIQENPS